MINLLFVDLLTFICIRLLLCIIYVLGFLGVSRVCVRLWFWMRDWVFVFGDFTVFVVVL